MEDKTKTPDINRASHSDTSIVKETAKQFDVNADSNANKDAINAAVKEDHVYKQEPKEDEKSDDLASSSEKKSTSESQQGKTSETDAQHTLKQNPNPAANENVPAEDKAKPESKEGAGTEITDGEAG